MFALCASLVLFCADAQLLPPIPDLSLVMNTQYTARLPLNSERPYDFVEGDLSDNDPYSDGEFDEKFWFHIGISHTLTTVDDDDGVEVSILYNTYVGGISHFLFKVVIPSCPGIKFRPYPYNNSAVQNYINLLNPMSDVFQPAYGVYQYDPSGGSYGREHIYEVQMRESIQACEETFNRHLNLIF
jgi:hypothetical protein